jgi:hemoglobin-like flavoprotein
MSPREILLIKNSWSFTVMHTQEAGELFYQKLFALDPTLEKLFTENSSKQAGKFMQMLTYLIMHLQQLDSLTEEVQGLAARHVAYGIQPGHIPTVGQALLDTLSEISGSRWDKETAHAWDKMYTHLAHSFHSSISLHSPHK